MVTLEIILTGLLTQEWSCSSIEKRVPLEQGVHFGMLELFLKKDSFFSGVMISIGLVTIVF